MAIYIVVRLYLYISCCNIGHFYSFNPIQIENFLEKIYIVIYLQPLTTISNVQETFFRLENVEDRGEYVDK